MGVFEDAERFEPTTLAEWSDWLARHHRDRPGVWLVGARTRGRRAVDYEAAVVEALRYGWIDSLSRSLDGERSMQWFGPRRPRSGWARSNKQRIARLEAEGRLEPAGRAVVEAARADGSWSLLDDVEDLVVPDDLASAFDERPGAREQWEGFSPSARRALLWWIATAKRAETRARRVQETADKAARGESTAP